MAPCGYHGFIHCIDVSNVSSSLKPEEIERRLLELGFIEGAEISILHEGPIGRDPIAVNVSGTTVALRRNEAMAILVHESPCHARFHSPENSPPRTGRCTQLR
nr:FeoA domain-containing protein [Falsochrobactrum shanghaiense]